MYQKWRKEMEFSADENVKTNRLVKMQYVTFCVPFVLAYIAWRWFPILVDYTIAYVLDYKPTFEPTHWLWYATVWFLHTWYVFLSIAIGGSLIIAAWAWRRRVTPRNKHYPMVSFVVPAYNEEKVVSKCIASLFQCAVHYKGDCEIIVVDDGSTDRTHKVALATVKMNMEKWPKVRGSVIGHKRNLGKVQAIKTGVNKAVGEIIATVDADSWWEPEALARLVDFMNSDGWAAVTGYIHPSDGNGERNLYVILQQLEYSQGQGIFRCAQALGNAVLVVPGPMGVYKADVLRKIVNEVEIQSITEDFEITLEMQKRGYRVGYVAVARSVTVAPTFFKAFWIQRQRWFIGGLHNMLGIHRNMLFSKRRHALLLWYCLATGYGGALLELVAVAGMPILYWFAPDRTYFLYNLLLFIPFVLLVGIIYQAVALKFAYNHYNHRRLLFYTPLYGILRFINVLARFNSLIKYVVGKRGFWKKMERPAILQS